MKRILSLTLCLLALCSSLAACAGGDAASGAQTGEAETSAAVSTSAAAETTTADPLADNLPAADYKGYKFRLYTFGENGKLYTPEAETGDVVNDAVFHRNKTVEDRYNVEITFTDSGKTKEADHRKAIKDTVLAGTEDFDLAINIGKQLACSSVEKLFLNLHKIDHLDFEKPWWSAQLVEDLTFRDCMYICSNNLHYEEFAASKVLYFNKAKIDSYKLENPYKTVFDNKWTIDRLISMTKDVYEDVNGNGSSDNSDFFGFLTTVSHNSWSVVFDIPEWKKNGDKLEVVAMSDKMLAAFDKIHDFYYNSKGLYTWSSYAAAKDEMRKMFINGQGMFSFGFVGDSGIYYRDTDVDYGIVPIPKYDEKQENYRIFFGANSSNMFAVPVFASDTARTGVVLEALSAEGYKQLIPAYYEVALKAKYLRDEDSVKMLDLVTECRTISFSYCYDNWTAGVGFGNCFQSDNKDNYTSFFESRKALLDARIAEVEKVFGEG